MKYLVSSDFDMPRAEVAEVIAALKTWMADPDASFAMLNAGLHIAVIRDDGTVSRLCHDHEGAEPNVAAFEVAA